MRRSKAKKEWDKLNEFEKKGHLAMFRACKPTDHISEEDAIKEYRKINSLSIYKELILAILIIIIYMIFN